MRKLKNTLTDVQGIKVGHAQDIEALTGCTVILCENGAVVGVDQRGGGPGTRETDLIRPLHHVKEVHAIVLAGGSAYGLDAASGVMRFLEEKGIGYDVRVARVPIVPAAILFDLNIGKSNVRPDAEMGYLACQNASSKAPAEGNVGAGTGASVGKILGVEHAMKSGIGSASVDAGGGVIVGAIAAVNAIGDVIDPQTNQIIAGARTFFLGEHRIGAGEFFADTLQIMKMRASGLIPGFAPWGNTVIGVVATNARLNKEEANIMAQMAHDGLARTIRPAHLTRDGDTIFALSTSQRKADLDTIGAFAAQVFSQAILNAVRAAGPVAGLPSISSLKICQTIDRA